jgi:hypothetical protein
MQLRQYLGDVFRKLAEQKEKPDRGRAFDVRPCAHDDPDPAEIRRVAGGRLHQGEECHPLGARLRRVATEFRGAELLGARVFRLHGRARRRGDSELHPQSGAGGQSPGADEPLAVTATSVAT